MKFDNNEICSIFPIDSLVFYVWDQNYAFFEKNGLILDQYYLGAFCSFSLYVTNATSKMFLANCAYPWKTSSWKEAYAMKL